MYKSWIKSRTIKWTFGLAITSFINTTYDVAITKNLSKKHITEYFTTLVGFYSLIQGRAEASSPLETPFWLPGPKKKKTTFDATLGMAYAAAQKDLERSQTLEDEIRNLPSSSDSVPVDLESKSNGEVTELVILGLNDKGKSYTITFEKESFIKAKLEDSSNLQDNELLKVEAGDSFDISYYVKDVVNHIRIRFRESEEEYFCYIPDLVLTNREGKKVPLEDNVAASEVKVKKTSFTLPDGSAVYLEDPVIPGGHISWNEFTHGGTRYFQSMNQIHNAKEVCKVAEQIRSHFKVPITVTSAYRDPDSNRAAGGSTLSVHCQAGALDIWLEGISPWDIYDYVNNVLQHRGGLASSTVFTHIDVAGLPSTANTMTYSYAPNRRWDYGF